MIKLLLFLILTKSIVSGFYVKDGLPVIEKLSEFSLCHQHRPDHSICLKALDNWLQRHPHDSWKAAKIVRANYDSYLALKYFKKAQALKEFNCKDRDLKESILSTFKLLYQKNNTLFTFAKNISFNKCSNNLPKIISKNIHSDSPSFKYLCKDLLNNGLLSEVDIKRCN